MYGFLNLSRAETTGLEPVLPFGNQRFQDALALLIASFHAACVSSTVNMSAHAVCGNMPVPRCVGSERLALPISSLSVMCIYYLCYKPVAHL